MLNGLVVAMFNKNKFQGVRHWTLMRSASKRWWCVAIFNGSATYIVVCELRFVICVYDWQLSSLNYVTTCVREKIIDLRAITPNQALECEVFDKKWTSSCCVILHKLCGVQSSMSCNKWSWINGCEAQIYEDKEGINNSFPNVSL